jgi:hypothetical protein
VQPLKSSTPPPRSGPRSTTGSPVKRSSVLAGIGAALVGVAGCRSGADDAEATAGSTAAGSTAAGSTAATASTGSTTSSVTPAVSPAARKSATRPVVRSTPPFFGCTASGAPSDDSTVRGVVAATGRHPTVLSYFQQIAFPFPATVLPGIAKLGATPMLSIETWAGGQGSPANRPADQPAYTLARIIDGQHDAALRTLAATIREFDAKVLLRLDHEMNATWYPWCEAANGNSAGEYVQMWRHVRTVFARAGVTRAEWVWAPNVILPGAGGAGFTPLAGLYPGDDLVDIVGLDGYASPGQGAWSVFDPTIAQLAFTKRPMIIAETGASGVSDKAGWIRSLGQWLDRRPRIGGFVWYQESDADDNWRFDDTRADLAAFRQVLTELHVR